MNIHDPIIKSYGPTEMVSPSEESRNKIYSKSEGEGGKLYTVWYKNEVEIKREAYKSTQCSRL